MKKVNGVVPMESILFEYPKAWFNHQSLLQDYEELQTETEDLKRKLLMMKQKKSMLMAEVRFLRRRHQYLAKNSSLDKRSKQVLVQPQRFDVQRAKKRKDLQSLADSNPKEQIFRGAKSSLKNKQLGADLNRKVKTSSKGRKDDFENPATVCNLSQKERIYGGKEADNRSGTPLFDLNKISREEEADLPIYEPIKAIQEPGGSLLRAGNNGFQDEGKISSCRKIESGSSGVRKRKISWQDQVALMT